MVQQHQRLIPLKRQQLCLLWLWEYVDVCQALLALMLPHAVTDVVSRLITCITAPRSIQQIHMVESPSQQKKQQKLMACLIAAKFISNRIQENVPLWSRRGIFVSNTKAPTADFPILTLSASEQSAFSLPLFPLKTYHQLLLWTITSSAQEKKGQAFWFRATFCLRDDISVTVHIQVIEKKMVWGHIPAKCSESEFATD